MLDTISDAVLKMTFENDLSHLVQSRLCRIHLSDDILTRNVFFDHTINRLHLTDDFSKTAMQIFFIHTLFHLIYLIYCT